LAVGEILLQFDDKGRTGEVLAQQETKEPVPVARRLGFRTRQRPCHASLRYLAIGRVGNHPVQRSMMPAGTTNMTPASMNRTIMVIS
jgi:hypothetical protein